MDRAAALWAHRRRRLLRAPADRSLRSRNSHSHPRPARRDFAAGPHKPRPAPAGNHPHRPARDEERGSADAGVVARASSRARRKPRKNYVLACRSRGLRCAIRLPFARWSCLRSSQHSSWPIATARAVLPLPSTGPAHGAAALSRRCLDHAARSIPGRAPVLLAGIRHDEAAPGEVAQVSVPANSILIVRGTNLDTLDLVIEGNLKEEPLSNPDAAKTGDKTGVERHFRITEDARITANSLPRRRGGQMVVPRDSRPRTAIELAKDPEIAGAQRLAALLYAWTTTMASSPPNAQFERESPPCGAAKRAAQPAPAVRRARLPAVLPQARTKNGAGNTVKDLTEHPWAGATVRLTLTAKDEGGNEGKSEPRQIRIPQRSFQKPVARALIEQRRELALRRPSARPRAGRARRADDCAGAFTPEPSVLSRPAHGKSRANWTSRAATTTCAG